MKYSMDFKPRIIFGRFRSELIHFNFYDYSKHKDIKCYDRDGESVVAPETMTHLLNKYYSGLDQKLTYHVRYEDDPELGKIFICRAQDANGLLLFVGYSEFSALQAVEDCENARKLILQTYWKPNEDSEKEEE